MPRLIKTESEIEKIRKSAKLAALVLRTLKGAVRPGITTLELDRLARDLIAESGGKPAFLGYRPDGSRRPYGFTICTSINYGVVHGLPSNYKLQDGDILKIDLGINWQGGISDTAVTLAIGRVDEVAKRLMKTTENALREGIRAAKMGHTVGDIGFSIERIVKAQGFKVVDGLTGHGVGLELHEEPTIYNYGKPGSGMTLKEGMVLAIEPITAIGTSKAIQLSDDSFITADKSLAAHFEHTILINKKGTEILTV